jgi:fatty acid synthase subunit alpha, fungi type
MSAIGLSLEDLQPLIKSARSHLPDNSKMSVFLHNSPKAFVITGTFDPFMVSSLLSE